MSQGYALLILRSNVKRQGQNAVITENGICCIIMGLYHDAILISEDADNTIIVRKDAELATFFLFSRN